MKKWLNRHLVWLLPVILLLYLFFTEFDLSLNEGGYMARYIRPLYLEKIEPKLAAHLNPVLNRLGFSGFDSGTAPVLPDDNVVGVPARVTRVIDGDTIVVVVDGVEEHVRYIGVNTPERNEPCFDEASDANSRLVNGRSVLLVRDQRDRDDYDRLLRYVYVGDVLVERELVARGYAEAVLYEPDHLHYEEFRKLEEAAARTNLNCHATGIFKDGNPRR